MQDKVLIIGAGRSGRGMLGDLYHKDGYSIMFADNNSDLVEGLRKQKYYTVKLTNLKTNDTEEHVIDDFEILDTTKDHYKYIEAIALSRFVSTALMPDAFDQVILDIVEAIKYKKTKEITEITYITLGANYVGLYEYYDTNIRSRLSQEDITVFDNTFVLIMSIVNRKNRLPNKEDSTSDKFRIVGDNKSVLRVESVPRLISYSRLPSFFVLENNLSAAMAIKIWSGNLVQCSLAFVALQHGCEDTLQAFNDKQAASYAYYASLEGYYGVRNKFNLPERSFADSAYTVTIFRNKDFQDSLYRITREPIRKFRKTDRFVGPALCALEYGMVPYFICKCLAYGFLYNNPKEKDCLELQKYIIENGIKKAVIHYCELDENKTNEKIVLDLVVNAYNDITATYPLKGV